MTGSGVECRLGAMGRSLQAGDTRAYGEGLGWLSSHVGGSSPTPVLLGVLRGLEGFNRTLEARGFPAAATLELYGRVSGILGERREAGVRLLARLEPRLLERAIPVSPALVSAGMPPRATLWVEESGDLLGEYTLVLDSSNNLRARRGPGGPPFVRMGPRELEEVARLAEDGLSSTDVGGLAALRGRVRIEE